MIETPDEVEVGAALLFVLLLIVVLAPIVERAEAVLALFDIMERGIR